MVLVGIEAGGTTFKLAVADASEITKVREKHVIPTTTPSETLQALGAWLKNLNRPISAVGVASFGPVDLDTSSKTYGHITSTPKPGWAMADIVGAVRAAVPPGTPIGFDTDVNAAALAELRTGGHGSSTTSLAYVTVGTGVGVGVAINGAPLHGLMHPEAGHIRVPRTGYDDEFKFRGTCPFHGDCLEGLVATPALTKRLRCHHSELPAVPDDHPMWRSVELYMAQLALTLTLTMSPHVIVLGGGVMQRKSLFAGIHKQFLALLNKYVDNKRILEHTDMYIVGSQHGDDIGLIGAFVLAARSCNQ